MINASVSNRKLLNIQYGEIRFLATDDGNTWLERALTIADMHGKQMTRQLAGTKFNEIPLNKI